MQDIIRQLIDLQNAEDKLTTLQATIDTIPQRLNSQQRLLQDKKAEYDSLDDKYKHTVVTKKEKEGLASQSKAKIAKFKNQLLEVKTNKEYAAIQAEIKHFELEISGAEESVIELLYQIDQLAEELKSKKEELTEAEESFGKEEQEKKAELAKSEKRLERDNRKRNKIAASIDEKHLNAYRRLLSRKNRKAIVPIKGESCMGCNMDLPPQHINDVRKKDKLLYCEGCGRILYWYDDYNEAEEQPHIA